MASCLSTSPSTESLVVSLMEPSSSSPVFPVAAISAAQSLEAALDYFKYHQDFQVAMMARPRRLKVRILTMKP